MEKNLEVKSISGDAITIPITSNTTVTDVKRKIMELKKLDCFEGSIKLIRKGKALDANSTLINENGDCDYVVYIINKINVGSANQQVQPVEQPHSDEPVPNDELVAYLETFNYSKELASFAAKASNNNLQNASLILTRIPATLLERLKYDDILMSIVLRDDYPDIMRLYQANNIQDASQLLESLQPGITEKLSNRVNDLIELINMFQQHPTDEESFSEYSEVSDDDDFSDEDMPEMADLEEDTILLSEEEMSVISKLSDMFGISLGVVYQIYMMCDKNEEATAGYLTEHIGDLR